MCAMCITLTKTNCYQLQLLHDWQNSASSFSRFSTTGEQKVEIYHFHTNVKNYLMRRNSSKSIKPMYMYCISMRDSYFIAIFYGFRLSGKMRHILFDAFGHNLLYLLECFRINFYFISVFRPKKSHPWMWMNVVCKSISVALFRTFLSLRGKEPTAINRILQIMMIIIITSINQIFMDYIS